MSKGLRMRNFEGFPFVADNLGNLSFIWKSVNLLYRKFVQQFLRNFQFACLKSVVKQQVNNMRCYCSVRLFVRLFVKLFVKLVVSRFFVFSVYMADITPIAKGSGGHTPGGWVKSLHSRRREPGWLSHVIFRKITKRGRGSEIKQVFEQKQISFISMIAVTI